MCRSVMTSGIRLTQLSPTGVDYDAWVGPAKWMPFNQNRFHYTWHWNWNFGTGDAGNDGAHQIDMARWALGVELPYEVSGSGGKLWFQDDQQTPDTINATFRYPGKMLMFEMRIWNSVRNGRRGKRRGCLRRGRDGSNWQMGQAAGDIKFSTPRAS